MVGGITYLPILFLVVIVLALVLLFAFTNGFHDAANVVATIIMTRAISPRKALLIAAACKFIAPFFLGSAVAKVIGKDVIDLSAFNQQALYISASSLIAALFHVDAPLKGYPLNTSPHNEQMLLGKSKNPDFEDQAYWG
jgi:PiT family inorganic phosphate transporter